MHAKSREHVAKNREHAAKNREHAAKNRTHAADILQGTWPTTVERRTIADSVFNLASTSILFQ